MENENKTPNEETQKTYSTVEPTKKCKHCQTEISAKAKICPNCKKKQKPSGCLTLIVVFVVLVVVGNIIGNGGGDSEKAETTTTNNSASTVEAEPETEETVEVEEVIQYTSYDVSEMMSDLNSNALKAQKKYLDQYVEITGELSNIDSNGKYISLTPADEDFAIIGVQCYIKSDEQTDKILEMSTGDIITLKGQVTNVGEVLGYSLDINSIE